MKIITDENEITPKLIEEILHKTQSLEEVEIKEIEKKTSSSWTSKICFIQVGYSDRSPKIAPKRLFLKMPGKGYASELGRREVSFYKSVVDQISELPVIMCYDAKFNEDTRESHILLEDISETHYEIDYPIPPTYTNCERFIEALSRIHVYFWDDENLEEFMDKNHWSKHSDYKKELKNQEEIVQKFLDFMGDRIPKPRRKILEESIEFSVKYQWARLKEGKNITLCMGDSHASNAFYPKDKRNGRIYLSDWQNIHVFRGVADLAYFMGVHWFPERRKRLEKVFLRKYHEKLREAGINSYSWEDCYNDYRSYIVVLIYILITWQWSAVKLPAIVWMSNLERALSAFEDLDCEELVRNFT